MSTAKRYFLFVISSDVSGSVFTQNKTESAKNRRWQKKIFVLCEERRNLLWRIWMFFRRRHCQDENEKWKRSCISFEWFIRQNCFPSLLHNLTWHCCRDVCCKSSILRFLLWDQFPFVRCTLADIQCCWCTSGSKADSIRFQLIQRRLCVSLNWRVQRMIWRKTCGILPLTWSSAFKQTPLHSLKKRKQKWFS